MTADSNVEERLEASLARGQVNPDHRQSPSLLPDSQSDSSRLQTSAIGSGASAFTRQTSLTNLETDDGTSAPMSSSMSCETLCVHAHSL